MAALGVLSMLPTAPAAGDGSTMVPLEHWGYSLVERLETTGLLSSTADGIRPFSRLRLARLALRADSAATAGQRLTRTDRQRLDLLLRQLQPEVDELRPPKGARAPKPDRGLTDSLPPFVYRATQGTIEADALLRQQTDRLDGRRRDGEMIYRNRVGAFLRGQLFGRVGYRVAFEQSREQGDRGYFLRGDVYERRLEAVQLKETLADFHEGAAYVTFGLGDGIDVLIGKDRVAWGPAPDNLGLSGNAPAFDMIRLRSRLGIFEFVSLHGALRPCPDRPDSPICAGEGDANATYIVNGMTRPLDRDKWIAAHRIEVALTRRLDVGVQEIVIYGDRGPEPAYLNPLMFYWAAQSYLGDKDNVMMGLDVDWRFRPGWRWYAAYAIDDLKKAKILSNDFANKYSLQSGLTWADPFGLDDVDLEAEFVRIEPWIYTHKFPINTVRHFDSPLGHSLEPNSDRWQVRVTRRWTRDLALSAAYSRVRHGANELLDNGSILNVGGDLHRGWRPGDNRDDKDFLDGNVSRRRAVSGEVRWRLWPGMQLRAGLGWEWGDNVPLAPRDGPATPLSDRTGFGDGRQDHLFFDLRYGVL